MSDCGCGPTAVETEAQRRTLWIALGLNAAMFVVETTAGLFAHSTGLVADGLDMLTDATAYAIALAAIGRSGHFKSNAATLSGTLLLLVGLGLLVDVVRRMLWGGEPEGGWMIAIAGIALAVNVYVLRLLSRQRRDEVHLKAAWIFTRADVVANAAVILAGLAVLLTELRYFDLVVGGGIALYVVKEALEILREARSSRAAD
ncbi:cation diffusion facilitator family transporter [Novosphingobium malaysiense]|uniref:Membrane protein n=1 Tax=Novosphingobium malaysiense TaxID=1348853 RepID=A0A0B1ZT30_9SPHN|nr:cation diffusion facilitator family transporter [Novosphingobium malaysiense]KHK92277.1 membrane protein [Novosphingobium malaysiense]